MRNNGIVISTAICMVVLLCNSAAAHNTNLGKHAASAFPSNTMSEIDPGSRGTYESTASDTYCVVRYTFESGWQGWSRVDNTAQVDTFFHVDDFAGLGGGDFGRLVPIQGLKSIWCGCSPNPADPYQCSWSNAPGYGNGWNQVLTADAFSAVGGITWSFHCVYDSEPDYDFANIEYDAGGLNWTQLAEFSGTGDTVVTCFIPMHTVGTKLRFHFISDAASSDQDGLWNTDGGVIIDEIRVHDQGVMNDYEDFETAPVGAKKIGIWNAGIGPVFGTYSGLWSNLMDKDPCGDDFGRQIVFFVGSQDPSSDYPGLFNTPSCTGVGADALCQNEMIVSPPIDLSKYSIGCDTVQDGTIPPEGLYDVLLKFTVYRDLPLENGVFYQWHVRNIVNGCPGEWLDDGYYYYGSNQDYYDATQDVSFYISDTIGVGEIQIGIEFVDKFNKFCEFFRNLGSLGQRGSTPGIGVGKIEVEKVPRREYDISGPTWHLKRRELFKDNFAKPGERVQPGSFLQAIGIGPKKPLGRRDYINMFCRDYQKHNGIATDNGLPAVYMHLNAYWDGFFPPPYGKPLTLAGDSLEKRDPENAFGRYWGNRAGWEIIQGNFATNAKGRKIDYTYCFGLNGNYFVPGYHVDYYFSAKDNMGGESQYVDPASHEPFCFDLYPKGIRILVIADAGQAADNWKSAFQAVLPDSSQPDFYFFDEPEDGVAIGPVSYLENAPLKDEYDIIIWDTGNLESMTISDGALDDEANDCDILIDWMSHSTHNCGLWICGDRVAFDLTAHGMLSESARTLMSTWCGVSLVDASYFDVTGGLDGGGVISPLITGDSAGIFFHGDSPNKFYVDGSCPIVNRFECLEKTANGQYALDYPVCGGTAYHAGIQSEQTNAAGDTVRTMWFGFSYKYVRDDQLGAPIDRFEIMKDVLAWMQGSTRYPYTSTQTPTAYALAQNYPNPFNPATTIKFGMKEKGLVTLKIYNVAGQLIRTLVNGVRGTGSYTVIWDGKNDRGCSVASGIYFCKMNTGNFSQTKKIVMLR